MPKYDYYCESNDQVVEVSHPMRDRLATWAEVCERAGIGVGSTPVDAPVKKLITGGGVVRASALKNPEPPCRTGAPCCGPQSCGLN